MGVLEVQLFSPSSFQFSPPLPNKWGICIRRQNSQTFALMRDFYLGIFYPREQGVYRDTPQLFLHNKVDKIFTNKTIVK